MLLFAPILLFLGVSLAQFENGYGSIFQTADFPSPIASSLRIVTPTNSETSNSAFTGASTWTPPNSNASAYVSCPSGTTQWRSRTTPTTLPISQFSGGNSGSTEVLATIEIQVGNLT